MKIPSYQQLSKEQDAIYHLPMTGSHLVIGAPGTGKTVLAIYRANLLRKGGVTSQFLVYSKPLTQYLTQATHDMGLENQTSTMHSWFWNWYKQTIHKDPPQVERFVFDWKQILMALGQKQTFEKYEHLIIDEGQDFPKDFYTVMRLIANNITVFADENQRITETNSTIKEIQQMLGIKQIHRLTKNYRNTRPVAEFASKFYANISSGIPELPTRKGPKPRLSSTASVAEQYDEISVYARNHTDQEIAIFVPKARDQENALKYLQERRVPNPIQLYQSGNSKHDEVNFEQPGIRIFAYKSAKGLEFDAVFLPSVENAFAAEMTDIQRMQFYVLASRSRQELVLLQTGSELPPFLRAMSAGLIEHRVSISEEVPF